MAKFKRKVVSMAVDQKFFDYVFEPARIRAKDKLGLTNLSQRDFTAMLGKGKVSLDIPLNSIRGMGYAKKTRLRKKR